MGSLSSFRAPPSNVLRFVELRGNAFWDHGSPGPFRTLIHRESQPSLGLFKLVFAELQVQRGLGQFAAQLLHQRFQPLHLVGQLAFVRTASVALPPKDSDSDISRRIGGLQGNVKQCVSQFLRLVQWIVFLPSNGLAKVSTPQNS